MTPKSPIGFLPFPRPIASPARSLILRHPALPSSGKAGWLTREGRAVHDARVSSAGVGAEDALVLNQPQPRGPAGTVRCFMAIDWGVGKW